MKTVELRDLKVGNVVLMPMVQPGDEEIEVLEIRVSPNMIGDGTAENYHGVANDEFPYQWSGLRTAGTGYADTTVRIKD